MDYLAAINLILFLSQIWSERDILCRNVLYFAVIGYMYCSYNTCCLGLGPCRDEDRYSQIPPDIYPIVVWRGISTKENLREAQDKSYLYFLT